MRYAQEESLRDEEELAAERSERSEYAEPAARMPVARLLPGAVEGRPVVRS